MKKWTLRAPKMLCDIKSPSFGSGAGLMIMIALAIFTAYQNASSVGLVLYGVFFSLCGNYDSFWDFFNAITSTQGIWIVSLFITVLLIIFTIVYLKRIEKRPLITAGFSRERTAPRYAAGFALGVAALLLCYSPSLVAEDLQYKGVSMLIPVYLLGFMVQSASEEIFFRGFLTTAISKRTGILTGVLISSVLFSLAHFINGGYSLLSGIYYTMIGAFLALLILRTNSIWASCGFHGAWNFTIGLLAPIEMVKGLVPIDYAIFETEQAAVESYGIIGDPSYLLLIGIFAAAIAILLFVGKNKLMMRVPRPASPLPQNIY